MFVATFTSQLRSSLVSCGTALDEAQARMFYMQLQLLVRSWQGRRGILRQHMGARNAQDARL